MHIAQIYFAKVPVQFYGGIERVIESLCQGFIELGHKVTLVCYSGDYAIPGVNFISLDKFKTVAEAMANINRLLPHDIDVAHFHDPQDFSHLKLPHLFTMHGNLLPEEKKTLPLNTIFLCANHAARHGREKFVFNGLNYHSIPFNSISLQERKYFAFLGRASLKRKGLSEAKKIAKKLKHKLLIGGGKGFSFGNHRFLGQLNNQEKFSLLKDGKALLFPISWEEPFGLAMIEAMFCGTPVFAFERGSVKEVLGMPGGKDLFLTAGSVEEMVSKAQHFNWSLSPERIRDYAIQYFSHLAMCRNYLKYYQEIQR